MPRQFSIRDRLESDAWQKHPGFAHRQALRHLPEPPRRSLKWQDRALLILAAVLLLLLIVRVETARANSVEESFWGIEIANDAGVLRNTALDTEVNVAISGLLAEVEVVQWFQNGGDAWTEAVYRYPLPDGAAVDRLRIEAGQRVIEGVIQEKGEARRSYQKAREEGRLASLVEQQRVNQFETQLANIAPGEEIRVSIRFLVNVDFRDGSYRFAMPLTFTPRWNPDPLSRLASDKPQASRQLASFVPAVSNPQLERAGSVLDDHYLSVEVALETGMPLAHLESRFHDVDIHPSLQGYRVFLADPDARSDRLFELNWTPEFGNSPVSTLMTHDDGEAVYALLMLAPPLATAIDPRPREVVFVIDTSGSMEGTSIEQARAALLLGLEHLGPDDRFNLIEFNSEAWVLFDESVPVYPQNLEEAREFIESLEANGGTNMAPAMRQAMNLPKQPALMRQIVFVTDGSVGNERELLMKIGEQLGDSRLFTVSIGAAPNSWFMRKAAEIGRGSHTQIGQLIDVEARMGSLWARIENPAVQNLCVDWGTDAEYYPEIVPDLYAGEPLWLFARLPHAPGEVTLCGELDGQPWESSSRLLPAAAGESLVTLWARKKIESLEDSRMFGSDPDQVRQEVLDLALDHGLLTAYTSLVAVDKTPVRPAAAELERNDIPSLLPAGSAVSIGFSPTATGWPLRLALSALSLLIATGMLLYLPPSQARRSRCNRSPVATSIP